MCDRGIHALWGPQSVPTAAYVRGPTQRAETHIKVRIHDPARAVGGCDTKCPKITFIGVYTFGYGP